MSEKVEISDEFRMSRLYTSNTPAPITAYAQALRGLARSKPPTPLTVAGQQRACLLQLQGANQLRSDREACTVRAGHVRWGWPSNLQLRAGKRVGRLQEDRRLDERARVVLGKHAPTMRTVQGQQSTSHMGGHVEERDHFHGQDALARIEPDFKADGGCIGPPIKIGVLFVRLTASNQREPASSADEPSSNSEVAARCCSATRCTQEHQHSP